MADDLEGYSDPAGDHIADRARAFSDLVAQAEATTDKKLKAECLMMLRAVRMSFKTARQGEAEVVTRLGQPVEKSGP
jgi:hypothetical protein